MDSTKQNNVYQLPGTLRRPGFPAGIDIAEWQTAPLLTALKQRKLAADLDSANPVAPPTSFGKLRQKALLASLRTTEPGVSILAGDLRERADKSALSTINRPLRFTRNDGDPHFLIVEQWSAKYVDVVDPASGRRRISAEEFDAGFTGVVIMLEPGAQFIRYTSSLQVSLRSYAANYIKVKSVFRPVERFGAP